MIRNKAASLLVALILTGALAGCGGPRNRDAVTFTQDDLTAAQWASDGYDAWRQEIDLDDALPTFSDLGAYPMGNGRVFGIAGLALPLIRRVVAGGAEAVVSYLERLENTLRSVLILTGSSTVAELRSGKFWLDPAFAESVAAFRAAEQRIDSRPINPR